MCAMKEQTYNLSISQAVKALQAGEVIAYPTESCFGLGCDPNNSAAIETIIQLKARSVHKGLILIAATVAQAMEYVELEQSPLQQEIHESWPGPNTWLLPARPTVLPLLKGEFPLLAIRVTAHPVAKHICAGFGGAIVSTSANVSGQAALLNAADIEATFATSINILTIVSGAIGNDTKPSTIRDGLTGEILRQ